MRYLYNAISHQSMAVNEAVIIGSENGLSPAWHQAIFWTNAGLFESEHKYFPSSK